MRSRNRFRRPRDSPRRLSVNLWYHGPTVFEKREDTNRCLMKRRSPRVLEHWLSTSDQGEEQLVFPRCVVPSVSSTTPLELSRIRRAVVPWWISIYLDEPSVPAIQISSITALVYEVDIKDQWSISERVSTDGFEGWNSGKVS